MLRANPAVSSFRLVRKKKTLRLSQIFRTAPVDERLLLCLVWILCPAETWTVVCCLAEDAHCLPSKLWPHPSCVTLHLGS